MIKMKDLLTEVGMGPTSDKDEETITIKHKTSEKEIVIVDTLKNRKKYTKMGYIIPLPKHLQKLIKDLEKKDREFKKYGVEVTDVIVPGLEWMNDIPEGVVKKGTQNLNERMGFSEEEYHKRLAAHYQTGIILQKMAQQMDKENRTETEHKVLHMSLGKYLKMLKRAFKL